MRILWPLPVLGPIKSILILPLATCEWITPSPLSLSIRTASMILKSKIFPLKYLVLRNIAFLFYRDKGEQLKNIKRPRF